MVRNIVVLVLLIIGSLRAGALEVKQGLYENGIRKSMPILIIVMPEQDAALLEVARIIGKNLERSGQFDVTVKSAAEPSKNTDLVTLFDQSYPLEIFLQEVDGGAAIGWRLYDVPDRRLIKGKKYTKRGRNSHGYADNVTDDLWPVLTSQHSSFSSKLAYVKKRTVQGKKDRHRSVVCIANSDGSQEQVIIPTLGTYVSLYWHHDSHNPCLFCSEFTRYNVRLVSTNLVGQKKTVLNLKGTCVGISVAQDNNKAVYCRSGAIWQYAYDPAQKQGVHTVLISNDGKNVSPTLLENGDIIFCSDASSLRKGGSSSPKIYRYNGRTKAIVPLIREGYCVGPSYCGVNNKIAYSKKVDGVMQLFVYDIARDKDTQITFDAGNKIDCCWSPCANFIVYCHQQGRTSRIASMHVAMRKQTFITPVHEYCTCPAWSPVYSEVPLAR